ncbi:DUF6207 family protein [Streptomyces sp. NPDC052114]|uniref:DUF6207 family protein n=1 Tax=unclassified Streptomyces TaxID=2593676 RepID=UPI003418384A
MTAIDLLLGRALLLKSPQVPEDTVPYEDTAYPAFTSDGSPLWDSDDRDLTDLTAAGHLHALCETAVSHCTPEQLGDFITDQLPSPHSAWLLGCTLQLASADTGARFWWQYAAGAGDDRASYCLYLHHLSLGDSHAAGFWFHQSGIATQDSDTDIPLFLRILTRLVPAAGRRGRRTETMTLVIDYVTRAVALGYASHPDLEIPLPGPYFAEWIGIILAVGPLATRPSRQEEPSTAKTLPNRPPLDEGPGEGRAPRAQEAEYVLEVPVADTQSAAAFKEAVAAFWEDTTADRTARPNPAEARLRYHLEPRPLTAGAAGPGARTARPS